MRYCLKDLELKSKGAYLEPRLECVLLGINMWSLDYWLTITTAMDLRY